MSVQARKVQVGLVVLALLIGIWTLLFITPLRVKQDTLIAYSHIQSVVGLGAPSSAVQEKIVQAEGGSQEEAEEAEERYSESEELATVDEDWTLPAQEELDTVPDYDDAEAAVDLEGEEISANMDGVDHAPAGEEELGEVATEESEDTSDWTSVVEELAGSLPSDNDDEEEMSATKEEYESGEEELDNAEESPLPANLDLVAAPPVTSPPAPSNATTPATSLRCTKFLQCESEDPQLPQCDFRDTNAALYVHGRWAPVQVPYSADADIPRTLEDYAYNYQPACNRGPFRCHIAEPHSCAKRSLDMLRYHWVPSTCNLRNFLAADLERMWTGKRIVLIGDSLMRQMFNSLRFLMRAYWQSPEDGTRKDPEYFATKAGARVEFAWSKYLLEEHALPERLVVPAQGGWPALVEHADWVVFNVGHHWHKKDQKFENYDTMVDLVLDAIQLKFRGSSLVFRTSAPGFYGCETMNSPVDQPQELTPDLDTYEWRKPIQAERIWQAKMEERNLQSKFRLLNVSLSAYRADAHVGNKVRDGEVKLDCLHWCMPGVPDYWNYLLFNLWAQDQQQ